MEQTNKNWANYLDVDSKKCALSLFWVVYDTYKSEKEIQQKLP